MTRADTRPTGEESATEVPCDTADPSERRVRQAKVVRFPANVVEEVLEIFYPLCKVGPQRARGLEA